MLKNTVQKTVTEVIFAMIYRNCFIFTGKGFEKGSFETENGYFKNVDASASSVGEDLEGRYVIPGLIDVHTHGNSGADFSDGDYNGLKKMARYLAENGITSFCPTSLTLPYEVLDKSFKNALRLKNEAPKGHSKVAGINMEGPFFAESRKGAQNVLHLRLPDYDAFKDLYDACEGLISIVDVAPELEGAMEFIGKANKLCTVSVAHTDCSYDDAKEAFEKGARQLTHLYNAMPSLHHRKPGPIAAGAERDDVKAELISDGQHVHPAMVRLAFNIFGADRICLISDALRCCGMPDGLYDLGGQEVELKDNVARLTSDGNIAGSATNLFLCMKKAVSFGIPLPDAIRAATLNPAEAIGRQNEIGSIDKGKRADFIICSKDFDLISVYIDGEKV